MTEDTVVKLVISLCIVGFIFMTWMVISMVYTFRVMYKQSKEFINSLKVGDKTNVGEVIEINGEDVTVKATYDIRDIRPEKFKCNNVLFMLKN